MNTVGHNCSIVNKIQNIQDTITSLTNRIRGLEDQLDSPNLEEVKRSDIQTELIEIKKLLDTEKEILLKLQKENRKSFMVASCLMFLCFLLFGVYCMIYGR